MGPATLFCCELAVGLGRTGEKTGGEAMRRSAGSPYSGPCLVWFLGLLAASVTEYMYNTDREHEFQTSKEGYRY
jgi:hypothetical protein